MTCIEVFADVVCPFTHVGLRRLSEERHVRGRRNTAIGSLRVTVACSRSVMPAFSAPRSRRRSRSLASRPYKKVTATGWRMRWVRCSHSVTRRLWVTLRSRPSTGPFSVTADINVTTGKTTTSGLPIDTPGSVININSDRQGFFPPSRATPVPAIPSRYFHYTDIVTIASSRSYYTVTAYNAAGDGPLSAIVCGSPVGYAAC